MQKKNNMFAFFVSQIDSVIDRINLISPSSWLHALKVLGVNCISRLILGLLVQLFQYINIAS